MSSNTVFTNARINGQAVWQGGTLRSVTGDSPAAGAEISFTVPARKIWRLQAVRVTFNTDANAGARVPVLIVDDGINEVMRSALPTGLSTISSAFPITFAPAAFTNSSGLNSVLIHASFPITIGPGYRLRTTVPGIQVGDKWGAPQFLVEEWIEP